MGYNIIMQLSTLFAMALSAVVALHGQLLLFLVHLNDGGDVEHHFHLETTLWRRPNR